MNAPRIGIAGVGGIGSNVAANLVRSGVDALKIVDFDRVEPSNLNRQFYFHDQIGRFKVEALVENLRRIRPGMAIEAIVRRIDAENCRALFAGCDIVVEGFDRAADKKRLLEALAGRAFVVSASGVAGGDLAGIGRRSFGGATIVGDFLTDCAAAPLFAHKVGTVANHMTECILHELGRLP